MITRTFLQARDLAHIVDCLADLFTCSVAGCMGAQVHTHTHCMCIVRALHIGCSVGSRMGGRQSWDQNRMYPRMRAGAP